MVRSTRYNLIPFLILSKKPIHTAFKKMVVKKYKEATAAL